ncbi:hypothetical protein HWQ17_10935 [Enterobacter pasteurii]|uniref:SrfA family protein n=1 Tax=Enterobacter pasteurii TaxID=3029761 RepID=UPI0011DE239D|nr:SrfA family protein [Enterobacter pasteurii]QLA68120.1 hypothetical protein HWQ17_10935 [Enterobacter pasteurii]
MAKPLLRSGYRNDFLALGENGKTIFESAEQIRETLRLRKISVTAGSLAIPQINDNNLRIDWYAPEAGVVTPWAMASEEQKKHALLHLEDCQKQLLALSERSLTASNTSVQLFGSMLPHLLRFPNPQHIYLINNLPVITFWGFVLPEDICNESPLVLLRTMYPEALPEPEEIPPMEAEQTPEDVLPPPLPAPQETIPVNVVPAAPQRKTTLRTMLLLVAFICLAASAVILFSELSQPSYEPVSAGEPASIPLEALSPPRPVNSPPRPETLPLQMATVTSAPVSKVVEIQPPPVKKIPKDALVLPENSVKAGSIKFLSGDWRVWPVHAMDLPDILGIRYHIYNGKGWGRVTHGKNSCQAPLNLGLMPSGNLIIKYHGRAKCKDGSHITLPAITCHQDITGPALCSTVTADGTNIPVKFRKVRG